MTQNFFLQSTLPEILMLKIFKGVTFIMLVMTFLKWTVKLALVVKSTQKMSMKSVALTW